MHNQKYDFEVYDGDLAENQKELDEWGISAFPVIQIIDIKTDGSREKIFQFPYRAGGWAPRLIDGKIRELNRKEK